MARALPMVARILARLRTMPGSAMRRATSPSSKAATTRRVEAAERGPEAVAPVQDERPAEAGLEALQGEALEQFAARP